MLKTILFSVSLLVVLSEITGVPKGSPCPALKLKFGRVRYRQKGRFVKFMCNTGYIIAGEKYSTCQNGVWDGPLPKCVRASCTKVNPPINGLIYPSHRGAVLNFFCKPGYDLKGPNVTYCDGYSWDNNLPACIATGLKPALSCDFESDDLCGWNHDLRHDFDWTRMNFRTPSGHLGTGPSYDHTKGEGDSGFYMYTESSSRNENDTARLISPIYDKMNDTNVCFEFFYHMHGTSVGQLRVYLKKESQSWDLDSNKTIFWESGNRGDSWLHAVLELGFIDEDFQIIIEGIRGSSYFSDIAIDDVKIIPNCNLSDYLTTENPVTDVYANFDSCSNRCDNDNLIVPPTVQYNCDCDDTCIDNNTCCPDYIAICVLGPIDDTTTVENPTTTEHSTQTDTTTPTTTIGTTKIVPTIVQKQKKVSVNITTNEITSNSVLPKKIQNITDIRQVKYPVVNSTSVNTTKIDQKVLPLNPPIKRPTLVFLTPSTSAVIVQKFKPHEKLTTNISTKITTVQQTITNLTTKLTTRKLIQTVTKQPKIITSEVPIDDILIVPTKPENNDVAYYTQLKTVTENNLNPVPIKKNEADVLLSSSKTQNQKIVKEESGSNAKFIMIIIVSVSLILLVVSSAVLLLRRYKLTGCRNRNKMYSSGSDSQSDVRFLTSDEMLDFNLACPDD